MTRKTVYIFYTCLTKDQTPSPKNAKMGLKSNIRPRRTLGPQLASLEGELGKRVMDIFKSKSFALFGLTSLLTASCAEYSFSKGDETFNQENPICDPFSGNGPISAENGLKGSIHFLDSSQPRYESTSQIIELGNLAPNPLYLNELNVPTRAWDSGFVSNRGDEVRAGENLLIEWFGIRLRSNIKLKPNEIPGLYQFALLSDDGAVLKQRNADGSTTEIINNDGNHPTRLGCSNIPVDFTASSRLPIEVDYYQGPRYHISLILLWRPYPNDATQIEDPLCGQLGNNLYFDSNVTPSRPMPAYQALLDRGWRPVAPENFYLDFTDTNQCYSE